MRNWIVGLVGFFALAAAAPGRADGLYRTNSGPGGADFSGVGLGVDLGAAIGSNGSISTSGVGGGAHVGYNLQNGPIVGGAEADLLFTNIRGGASGFATFNESSLGTVRAKGGYAFGDILAYGTLGWAWSLTNYQSPAGSSGQSLRGVAYGVGAELAVTRNVTLRAELRRYDFGQATFSLPTGSQSVSTSDNMLLLGATTHF